MQVTRIDRSAATDAPRPIFVGRVLAQTLVGEDAEHLRVGAITFTDGARTRWHYHDYEQLLVITDGRGILATRQHEHPVAPGDVVYVPRAEEHWHGAVPGASMTHVSVNQVGETTVLDQ